MEDQTRCVQRSSPLLLATKCNPRPQVKPSNIFRCPIGTPGALHHILQRNLYTLPSGPSRFCNDVGMFRRLWKPVVGATVLVGAPSYFYFKYSTKPQHRETFNLPVRVRGPDGKPTMVNRSIPLLTKEEADARLTEHAASASTVRPGGVVWTQSTAFLPSNDPIEDANASQIIQRDPSDPAAPGDLLFFAVMDGHAGYHTSRLLSKVLIPSVALELSLLINQPSETVPKASVLQDLRSLVWPVKATPVAFDEHVKHTSLAIQRAFTNLDSEIVDSPLRIIAEEMSRDGAGTDKKTIPNLSQHPMAVASMLPAMSGENIIGWDFAP